MNSNMSICICVLLSLCTDKTHVLELTLSVLCTIYMNTYVQVGMYKCVSLAWCVFCSPPFSTALPLYLSFSHFYTVSARILWRSLFNPVYIHRYIFTWAISPHARQSDNNFSLTRTNFRRERAHAHDTRSLPIYSVFVMAEVCAKHVHDQYWIPRPNAPFEIYVCVYKIHSIDM